MHITRTTDAEWRQCKEDVLAFFERRDGLLYHNRIERDLLETLEISKKKGEAAAKRWDKGDASALHPQSKRNANDMLCHSSYSDSYSKDNIKEKEEEAPQAALKPSKHKYGEYENVLLSDAERDRLLSELGQDMFDSVVAFYSSWKREKGKVSKDDNLTIRRWVIEAVKEKRKAAPSQEPELSIPIFVPDPAMKDLVDRHYADLEARNGNH
jgi:uncharacterized protein YdaU (DUF1376 family)